MRVLLRRFLLLAACIAAGWYFWYTPSAIIGVRVLDLADEYQSRVARRVLRSRAADRLAAEGSFVRNHTNPGSAERYRQNVLSTRPLTGNLAISQAWVAAMREAAAGRGPLADRYHGQLAYFAADETPVAAVTPALRASLGRTGFLNAYTTVGADDLEFMIFPEPRSSDAPARVMYPMRGTAGLCLLAGLLLYGVLGLSRRPEVSMDPLPLVVLDLAAALGVAFLCTLPLRLAPSPAVAVDDPLSGLVWFCGVALLPFAGLMMLAGREAFGLQIAPDGVLLRGLFRARWIPFEQIRSASPEPPDQPQTAIRLRLASGEQIRLPWAGVMGMLTVADTLRLRGLLRDDFPS